MFVAENIVLRVYNQVLLFLSIIKFRLAALTQMVACLPLVQQIRGSIPSGVVNFHLKIFNLGARRGGDCTSQSWIKFQPLPQYILYVEKAYSTVDSDSSVGWGR